jgi:hypothetical protein
LFFSAVVAFHCGLYLCFIPFFFFWGFPYHGSLPL